MAGDEERATAARFDDRRDPIRPLRLFALFFRVGALNELQYRANLAIQLFQSAIAVGTGLAVLGLVFGQTSTFNPQNHHRAIRL